MILNFFFSIVIFICRWHSYLSCPDYNVIWAKDFHVQIFLLFFLLFRGVCVCVWIRCVFIPIALQILFCWFNNIIIWRTNQILFRIFVFCFVLLFIPFEMSFCILFSRIENDFIALYFVKCRWFNVYYYILLFVNQVWCRFPFCVAVSLSYRFSYFNTQIIRNFPAKIIIISKINPFECAMVWKQHPKPISQFCNKKYIIFVAKTSMAVYVFANCVNARKKKCHDFTAHKSNWFW